MTVFTSSLGKPIEMGYSLPLASLNIQDHATFKKLSQLQNMTNIIY
jgi:hypothetical protein